MAIEFNFTVSAEEARKAFAERVDLGEWIELFEEVAESYGDWRIDLKIASHFVKKVKEGYIDNTLSADIPENLLPLLGQSITESFKKGNEKNKDTKIEDTSGEAEFKAIEVLRSYKVVDYVDAISIFCDGYDYALETASSSKSLEDFSTEELLNEIKRRTL